jgi:hypothetical protein
VIHDTCPCGAEVVIDHGLINSNNERHDVWLTQHDTCREAWATRLTIARADPQGGADDD